MFICLGVTLAGIPFLRTKRLGASHECRYLRPKMARSSDSVPLELFVGCFGGCAWTRLRSVLPAVLQRKSMNFHIQYRVLMIVPFCDVCRRRHQILSLKLAICVFLRPWTILPSHWEAASSVTLSS